MDLERKESTDPFPTMGSYVSALANRLEFPRHQFFSDETSLDRFRKDVSIIQDPNVWVNAVVWKEEVNGSRPRARIETDYGRRTYFLSENTGFVTNAEQEQKMPVLLNTLALAEARLRVVRKNIPDAYALLQTRTDQAIKEIVETRTNLLRLDSGQEISLKGLLEEDSRPKTRARTAYKVTSGITVATLILAACSSLIANPTQSDLDASENQPKATEDLPTPAVTTIPQSTNTAENPTSTPEVLPTPKPTEVLKGYIPGAIPEGGNIVETVRTSSSTQGGSLDTSVLKNKGFIVFAETEEATDKDGNVIGENFNVAKKQQVGEKAYWYVATPDEMFYEIDKDADGNPIYRVARRVTDTGETIQVYRGENGEIVYRLISVYEDTTRGTPVTVSDQSTSEGVVSVKFMEDGLIMSSINPFINTPDAEGLDVVVEGDQISITNGVDRKAHLVIGKNHKGEWKVKEFFKVEDYYDLGPAEVEVVDRSDEDLTQKLSEEASGYEPIHNTFTLYRHSTLKSEETGEVAFLNGIQLGPFVISDWETRKVILSPNTESAKEIGELELTLVYKNQFSEVKTTKIVFRGGLGVNKDKENIHNAVDPRDFPSNFKEGEKVDIAFLYLGSSGYIKYERLADLYELRATNKDLADEYALIMRTLSERKGIEDILEAFNSGQGIHSGDEKWVFPDSLTIPIEY